MPAWPALGQALSPVRLHAEGTRDNSFDPSGRLS